MGRVVDKLHLRVAADEDDTHETNAQHRPASHITTHKHPYAGTLPEAFQCMGPSQEKPSEKYFDIYKRKPSKNGTGGQVRQLTASGAVVNKSKRAFRAVVPRAVAPLRLSTDQIDRDRCISVSSCRKQTIRHAARETRQPAVRQASRQAGRQVGREGGGFRVRKPQQQNNHITKKPPNTRVAFQAGVGNTTRENKNKHTTQG